MIAVLEVSLLVVITIGAAAALVVGIHPYVVAVAAFVALAIVHGITRALR